jgi:hypothetical protein
MVPNYQIVAAIVTVLGAVCAGLAAYWKGQAALSRELIAEIRRGDEIESRHRERDIADVRREADERKGEYDKRLNDFGEHLKEHDARLRSLERER